MAPIIRPSLPARQSRRWHDFDDCTALEQAAARAIIQAANTAIRERGQFHMVLAGGNTPRHVYALLRDAVTDWRRWHIYFGDERCLPADHAERNSVMADDAWLVHVAIPHAQIHAIPTETGAASAALIYTHVIDNIELFDLTLLGLGEDGHTASLFPLQEAGIRPDSPSVIEVHNAPKPPSDRVSLSARRLSESRQVVFLVTGESKHQAIKEWREGAPIPASLIRPANGVDIYFETKLLAC